MQCAHAAALNVPENACTPKGWTKSASNPSSCCMQGLPPIAAERVDECLTVDIQACALKLCKVPAAVLHALHDIRLRPASQVVLEMLEHIVAAYAQPSPSLCSCR